MGLPIQNGHVAQKTARGAGNSPQTAGLDAPSAGLCSVVDSIAYSNTAGGTATTATVSIQEVVGGVVVWEIDVELGAVATPVVSGVIAIPGGIYKGKKDKQLNVVFTMTGASAIKLNAGYHDETPT